MKEVHVFRDYRYGTTIQDIKSKVASCLDYPHVEMFSETVSTPAFAVNVIKQRVAKVSDIVKVRPSKQCLKNDDLVYAMDLGIIYAATVCIGDGHLSNATKDAIASYITAVMFVEGINENYSIPVNASTLATYLGTIALFQNSNNPSFGSTLYYDMSEVRENIFNHILTSGKSKMFWTRKVDFTEVVRYTSKLDDCISEVERVTVCIERCFKKHLTNFNFVENVILGAIFSIGHSDDEQVETKEAYDAARTLLYGCNNFLMEFDKDDVIIRLDDMVYAAVDPVKWFENRNKKSEK